MQLIDPRRCFRYLTIGAWLLMATVVPTSVLSADVTAAFTPGRALSEVVELIGAAQASVEMAAYSFTSKPIAVALRDASRRGVVVRVVVDAKDAANGYSAARFLANEGVSVRTNARYAIQHNKFMVIDGTTVQTGSFNYTRAAAERNAENVLIVRNAPQIAQAYAREWQRLWAEGVEMAPSY